MKTGQDLLAVEEVSCSFGGLRALSDVSFVVPSGQIAGLIGPNGAGKTTMFNVISGMLKPDKGRVFFKGKRIDGRKAHQIVRMGLARTFQIPQAFPSMTVRQTLQLAMLAGGADGKKKETAADFAGQVKLEDKLDYLPNELTTVDLHSLEVAKVLASGAELILLDEVFSGLNPTEIDQLVSLIRDMRDQKKTFLIIEHRMRAVMALCDIVTVLAFGEIIASGEPSVVTHDKRVIEVYLGTKKSKNA